MGFPDILGLEPPRLGPHTLSTSQTVYPALAGAYLELTGDTPTADRYFEKAGTEYKEKIDALFE